MSTIRNKNKTWTSNAKQQWQQRQLEKMVDHGPHKRQKVRPSEQTPWFGPTNISNLSLEGNGYSEDTRRIATYSI